MLRQFFGSAIFRCSRPILQPAEQAILRPDWNAESAALREGAWLLHPPAEFEQAAAQTFLRFGILGPKPRGLAEICTASSSFPWAANTRPSCKEIRPSVGSAFAAAVKISAASPRRPSTAKIVPSLTRARCVRAPTQDLSEMLNALADLPLIHQSCRQIFPSVDRARIDSDNTPIMFDRFGNLTLLLQQSRRPFVGIPSLWIDSTTRRFDAIASSYYPVPPTNSPIKVSATAWVHRHGMSP